MLALLEAIANLPSLARLIVLQECANPGRTMAYDGVSLVETEGGERALMNDEQQVLFTLHERDDDLCFQRGGAVDEPLNRALALLGTGRTNRGLAEGDWITYQALEDRAAGLDQAYVLSHQLKSVADLPGNTLPIASDMLELARRWRAVRHAIYVADNCAWQSKRAAASNEAQEQALLADVKAFNDAREAAGHTVRLRCESDPRGTAVTVMFGGDRPRTLGLVGLPLSWVPHEGAPSKPRRRTTKASAAQVAAPTTTRVPEDVAAVLRAASCDGATMRIAGQLDAKLYARVDKVLKGMGARWVSSKNGHVFKGDAAPIVAAALADGSITTDRDWEFFATPNAIVQKMLSKVTLRPGMKAAEPNGGEGAIALELARVLGRENVQCFELMPRNAATLSGLGFPVVQGDFLAEPPSPRYDVILMNPPFSNQADTLHIQHAAKFLKPGGELVAICSPSWQLRSSARAVEFREWVSEMHAEIEELPAGAFKESGTDVATLMLTIRLPASMKAGPVAAARTPAATTTREQLDLFAEAA